MKSTKSQRVAFRVGKRIFLRALSPKDVPLLTVWINDQKVHKFLKVAHPMSEEDEEKFVRGLCEKKAEHVIFGICLKSTDELIGVMGLNKIDHRNGLAVTGSFIGIPRLWGKGYGTEAKMLVLEYAFNTLNLRKICSMVFDFNPRSKACLEKCGYKVEGVRKHHIFREGRYADEFLLAVFKEDFIPLWQKYRKKHGL